jgi:putative SOS response-associated peptidase YedK
MAFAEPDKTTPKGSMMWRWFKRWDGLPFCFAGIWRPWTGDRGTKKAPNVGDGKPFVPRRLQRRLDD